MHKLDIEHPTDVPIVSEPVSTGDGSTCLHAAAVPASQNDKPLSPHAAKKQAKKDRQKEKRRAKRQKEHGKFASKYLRRHPEASPEDACAYADAKMEKKKKRRRRPIGSIILMVFGALLLAFPIISDLHASWVASQAITSYTSTIESMSQDEKDLMLGQARAYNNRLSSTSSPDDCNIDGIHYDDILDTTGTGIMGAVVIECIGVNQPIYHGTKENTLMSGVGHLEGSSFPFETGATHAAIAGHTGMPGQRMFDELVDLEPGDIVKVKILDTETWYEVRSSEVVDPNMTTTFSPEVGHDYLTLITCTPYGINDHRLLVHCEAVPSRDQSQSDFGVVNVDKLSKYINLRTIPVIITVILVLCGIFWRITKKLRIRRKKKKQERAAKKAAEQDAGSKEGENQASTSSSGTPE